MLGPTVAVEADKHTPVLIRARFEVQCRYLYVSRCSVYTNIQQLYETAASAAAVVSAVEAKIYFKIQRTGAVQEYADESSLNARRGYDEGFNLKRDTVGTLLRIALRQLQVQHIIIPSIIREAAAAISHRCSIVRVSSDIQVQLSPYAVIKYSPRTARRATEARTLAVAGRATNHHHSLIQTC
jgi:hypothetical protein